MITLEKNSKHRVSLFTEPNSKLDQIHDQTRGHLNHLFSILIIFLCQFTSRAILFRVFVINIFWQLFGAYFFFFSLNENRHCAIGKNFFKSTGTDSQEVNVKFHGGKCSGGEKRSRIWKKKMKRKAIFELENERR